MVVGFGGAGAAAAITAADLGADVVIVEKQPREQHTPSTRLSGGRIMTVNDAAKATRYLDACAQGMVPVAVSAAWAHKATRLIPWMEEVVTGLRLHRVGGCEHLELEGAESIDVVGQSTAKEGDLGFVVGESDAATAAGPALFAVLKAAVERRPNIRIRWNQPATRLLRRDGARVSGVEVRDHSGSRRVDAGRAVILTSGGYEHDQVLKQNYLRAPSIYFYSNPGNTGDGVRMAQAVGADLWHMNQMIGRGVGHFELSDGRWKNFLLHLNPPGYVLLDKNGLRFANEYPQAMMKHGFYHELVGYDAEEKVYPRIPCYWFFDQRRIRAAPLTPLTSGEVGIGLLNWSPDNQKEVERGWIKAADTIEEVARLAGVADPKAAARSIDEYNNACATGLDRFGRPSDSLVPLDRPPYYCVPLYPGGSNTTGGPRRNEHAQIVDVFGDPIPGLYGAGELGQATGLLCPSNGCNLSDCLSFGQIASESALSH